MSVKYEILGTFFFLIQFFEIIYKKLLKYKGLKRVESEAKEKVVENVFDFIT